jgi:hypothetical protein
VPETVEGAQRVLRLVVRPTRERGQNHRRNPAQPELEPDLVRPQTIVAPIDERNRPGQVAAVELGAAALTDEDQPTRNPLRTGLGNTAERGALDPTTKRRYSAEIADSAAWCSSRVTMARNYLTAAHTRENGEVHGGELVVCAVLPVRELAEDAEQPQSRHPLRGLSAPLGASR